MPACLEQKPTPAGLGSPKFHGVPILPLPDGAVGVQELSAGHLQVPVIHLQHLETLRPGLQAKTEQLLNLDNNRISYNSPSLLIVSENIVLFMFPSSDISKSANVLMG